MKSNFHDKSSIAVLSGIGGCVAATLTLFNLWDGNYRAALIEGLVMVMCLLNLVSTVWAFRGNETLDFLHRMAVPATVAAIIAVEAITGEGSALYWSVIVPPLAFFSLGLSVGTVLSGALLLSLAFMTLGAASRAVSSQPGIELLFIYVSVTVVLYCHEVRTLRTRRSLEHAAETDPLTGTYNRSKLHAVLQNEVERDKRYGGGVALLIFDIDRFKQINDRHGHRAGDRILRELPKLVRENTRTSDSLFRFGGDEFVVVALGINYETAAALGEKLRTIVGGQHYDGIGTVHLSVGVAVRQEDESAVSLLARADKALYAAKSGGRNRSSVAPSMEQITAQE